MAFRKNPTLPAAKRMLRSGKNLGKQSPTNFLKKSKTKRTFTPGGKRPK